MVTETNCEVFGLKQAKILSQIEKAKQQHTLVEVYVKKQTGEFDVIISVEGLGRTSMFIGSDGCEVQLPDLTSSVYFPDWAIDAVL